MASSEDVILTFKAVNQVGNVVKSIGSSVSQLGLVGYQAISSVSSKMNAFGNECTELAKSSETGWIAFNNALRKSGVTSADSMSTMKSEVKGMANELGISVGDARTSFTSLDNKLGDTTQSLLGLKSAQALAVASGQSLEASTGILTSALNGRGTALKRLGIDIENYKNANTGAIDSEKLFNDIINKNQQGLTEYGNSVTAVQQRLENSILSFESKVGTSMANLQSATAPIISGLIDGIGGIDDATGGLVSTFVGLSTSAVGGLGQFADASITITSLVEGYKALKVAMEEGMIIKQLDSYWTSIQTGATEAYALVCGEATIAEIGLLAPLLLIIGAIAVLGVAVYKVGEYFGWWKDLPSMFEAIKSGVMRLWAAFVNNPLVKETIRAIGGALNWLKSLFAPLISAAHRFFQIPTQNAGKWDIVQSIINIFGALGNMIVSVVGKVKIAISSLANFVNFVISIPSRIAGAVSSFVHVFATGFNRITSTARTTISRIPSIIFGAIGSCVGAITSLGSHMVAGFRSGFGSIISWLSLKLNQIPSLVANKIGGCVGAISSLGSRMVSGFRNSFGGIISWLSQELNQIPSLIANKIGGCASAIANLGSSMWKSFKGAIGIASPSLIYKSIMWDLEDMPSMIKSNMKPNANAISDFGSNLMNGYYNGLTSTHIPIAGNYGYSNVMSAVNAIGGQGNNKNNTTIQINEGAVQLDARNLTTKESKQIMINALEGLDSITNISVRGE